MVITTILLYIGVFLGLYFGTFVLVNYVENKRKIYKGEKTGGEFPTIALIVPCYNEENTIEKTVNSLLNLEYPKEKLELLVVDDGSKDRTYERVKKYENQGVKIYRKENGGKHTAMNTGLSHTNAELLGSVDADSSLHPKALKRLTKYFEDPETKAVIGSIKISKVESIVEGFQYVEFLIGNLIKKTFSIFNSINVAPGPLAVFRKEVFEKLGLYREGHLTEDLEMAFRLHSNNMKIAHSPDAIAYTEPRPSIKSLSRQRLRWRRGFLLNLRDYPSLLNFRKHGNLSFLILYQILGSFVTLWLLCYIIWNMSALIFTKINQAFLIGWDIPTKLSFNVDSFLFHLGLIKPETILMIMCIALVLVMVIVSKPLTRDVDKKPLKRDTPLYLFLYIYLNTAWWIGAVYLITLKKTFKWK